ncbi:hypothetical protein HY642_02290 [Candidatus Woesearchaeota archaeon]|nr:hypothetical protein [Candidatus Woesearchaeota archaeon]
MADVLQTLAASAAAYLESGNWADAKKTIDVMPTYVDGAKIVAAKAQHGG